MAQEFKVTSVDISEDKYSAANLATMHERFPTQDANTLARFLIARNDDLTKATDMLTQSLQWRADNWPVLKESAAGEINKGKLYVRGVDKDGRPLLIYRCRFHIAKERDLEEMTKMAVWWIDYVLSKCPPDKTKFTLLVDRTDFSHENGDMDFLKHLSKVLQDNYPETLCRCVVYPSNFVFYAIWNIGKWFLDPVTRLKVQPMMAFSGVQQFVEDEYIPSAMGGECEYDFNPDDFPDPYSPEVIAAAVAKRAAQK